MERKFGDYRALEAVGGDSFGQSFLVGGKVGAEVLWLTLTTEEFSSMEQSQVLDGLKPIRQLNAHNVLELKDGGFSSQDHLFFVYEFFNGSSLDTVLKKNDPLFWVAAMGIAHEICVALAHGHREGIAHGRLTPAAVLVDENGQVKLRGLGTQAVLDSARGEISLAGSQMETDIQALGGMVREMLCGKGDLPQGLPSIVQKVCEWELAPVTAEKGVELCREALRMGGVQDPQAGLQAFFKEWSFFFLLNRMFSEERETNVAPSASEKGEASVPVSFDEVAPDAPETPTTAQSGWADDLGGVFLDVEELPDDSDEGIQRSPGKSFEALDSLAARDREDSQRKKAWMRNLLLGASVILVGVIAVALITIMTGPSPEEMARLEMMEEFPRFQDDFSDLKVEVVRTPAQPEDDPEVGGTVVSSWKETANELLLESKLEEARGALSEASRDDQGDWRRHVAWANSLLPDKPEEAAKVLEEFMNRVPKSKLPRLVHARILTDFLGKHRAAMAILEEFHQEYGQDPAYLELLFRLQGKLRDWGGQIVTLKSRIRLPGGDTPGNQLRLAFAHAAASDHLRARKAFYELIEHAEEDIRVPALWGFISTSRSMKEIKPMVEVARGALGRTPSSPELLLFLSEYSLSRRKYQEADGFMKRLEEVNSSWVTQMLRGVSAFRQGRYKEARGLFLLLREERPDDGRITFNLGMTLREMELNRLSYAAFSESAKVDPTLWEPLCAMGQDYLSMGDFESARKLLTEASDLNPHHPWLSEILEIELKSAKAESLAAKPCMNVGLFEDTSYERPLKPPAVAPVPFSNSDLSVFSPDFRTLKALE